MAGEIIGLIDSLDIPATAQRGGTPDFIYCGDNIGAVVYFDSDIDGKVSTFTLSDAGVLGNSLIATLEFDTDKCINPEIIAVTGIIYAIVYRGPDDDGWIKTISIDSDGAITELQSLEFDVTRCDEPTIVHLAGENYAIAYSGSNGLNIATVSIDSSGNLGNLNNSEIYNAGGAFDHFPHMLHISGTIYAIVYADADGDGRVSTIDISDAGVIGASLEDDYEFDEGYGTNCKIIHIAGQRYAVSYFDSVKIRTITITITTAGAITKARIDTQLSSEAVGKWPHLIHITSTKYALVYQGIEEDGWIEVYDIAASGVIKDTVHDSLEIEDQAAYYLEITHITGDTYIVCYQVGTASNSGTTIRSVGISTPAAVYPSDPYARVSSIRHIFRPGSFRMQVGLGDLGFDIDVAEAAIRKLVTAEVETGKLPEPSKPAPVVIPCPPGQHVAYDDWDYDKQYPFCVGGGR